MDCSPMLIAAVAELENWLRQRTHHAQHCRIELTILPNARSDYDITICGDAISTVQGHSTHSLLNACLSATEID